MEMRAVTAGPATVAPDVRTGPVVLSMGPGVAGAMTSMRYVQWLDGTRVVFKRLVVVPPELPLAVPALPPVQKPLILFGDATTRPPVRLSVKLTPVRVTVVL